MPAKLRVLVACEFSGIVREEFRKRGHDAWSCDIVPSEQPGPHHLGTIFDRAFIRRGWDILIAHWDCTFLAGSGARWFKEDAWREEAMLMSLHAIKALWAFPIRKKCLENPIGRLSTLWMKPTQIIQPWMFGEPETKATCLWLDGLPKLIPTNIVAGRNHSVHHAPPGPTRKADRSRTFAGIAAAMAEQWGGNANDHP